MVCVGLASQLRCKGPATITGTLKTLPQRGKSLVRIWDVHPSELCRAHLLGEHRELHGLWNILTLGKRGYSAHPETLRWVGRLTALYIRHEALVAEMDRRGYRHASPLDRSLATGSAVQDRFIDSPEEQRRRLAAKGCGCANRRGSTA